MANEDPQRSELLAKVREGVEVAASVIGEIDTGLLDCAKRLRVDPSNETFSELSARITNLGDLVALVREVRKGAEYLEIRPGTEVLLPFLEMSVDLFRGMQAAMERKDWVTLADLIQYELSPVLSEGNEEFAAVLDLLSAAGNPDA